MISFQSGSGAGVSARCGQSEGTQKQPKAFKFI